MVIISKSRLGTVEAAKTWDGKTVYHGRRNGGELLLCRISVQSAQRDVQGAAGSEVQWVDVEFRTSPAPPSL